MVFCGLFFIYFSFLSPQYIIIECFYRLLCVYIYIYIYIFLFFLSSSSPSKNRSLLSKWCGDLDQPNKFLKKKKKRKEKKDMNTNTYTIHSCFSETVKFITLKLFNPCYISYLFFSWKCGQCLRK